MTPLQQAAKNIIESWDLTRPVSMIAELRKALAAEQAQAVGPIAWCKPFKWLLSPMSERREVLTQSERAEDGFTQPLYTHPAPPPSEPPVKQPSSTERAVESVCRNCMGFGWEPSIYSGRIDCSHCKTAALKPPQESKQPSSTERAALINTPEKVREFFGSNFDALHYGRDDQAPDEDDKYTMSAHDIISAFAWSADMLEADVSLINEGNKAQQVAVPAETKTVWVNAIPPGFVLVPIEPTPQMAAAGFYVTEAEHDPAGVYRAMLTAAPQGDKT